MASWFAGIRLPDGKDQPVKEYATWDGARDALREMADAHHADAQSEAQPTAARELKVVLSQINRCAPDLPHYLRGNGLTFFIEARPA